MSAQPAIHIRHLRIRVPGTTLETGQALAEALRDQLGELPAARPVHFGAMNLRVPAPDPANPQALPGAITTTIANRLQSPAPARHA